MKTVYFSNDGLIDLTAVSTFGINAKETEDPFGFFGTGLKYAIAILLRNNQEITIWRGKDKHTLTLATKEIRNKTFNIVCLDGQEIGFTTELGKTWKMWQAFRELYCNTMDENGTVGSNEIKPQNGKTVITVTGDDFYQAYLKRSEIILETKPEICLRGVDIHRSPSRHLYYRTIRVAELDAEARFTYNFTSPIELTEDRTIKYASQADRIIRESVLQGDNEAFIREFACAPDQSFEGKMDLDWSTVPNALFIRVINDMDFKDITNHTLLNVYKKHANTNKAPQPASKTDIEIKQLEKAIGFCKSIGYPVDKYRINVTDDLRENTLGIAYCGEIYIARRTFMQGTKQVAATLLEEYLHLAKGYQDETYLFQTYLFDVIVSLGERLAGEPI